MSGNFNGGPSAGNSLRKTLLKNLTRLSHASAPFISTFVIIHLTAPAMANLGGSSLASQIMLLGREYYQTAFGEKYLLLGPLIVHAVAGTAKRLLSPSAKPPRPCSSLLSWTGYATALFFLPMHYMTHRYNPMDPAPPVSAIGPSELDYEFVKLGLQNWPVRSWFLYAGLLIPVVLHMVDGWAIIWNTWLKESVLDFKQWATGAVQRRRRNMALVLAGLALPVMTGLYALSKEPLMLFSSMASRLGASTINHSFIVSNATHT